MELQGEKCSILILIVMLDVCRMLKNIHSNLYLYRIVQPMVSRVII
jgi:hypothetical protein